MDERARLKKEYDRLSRAAARAERRLEKIGAEWLAVANKLNECDRGIWDRRAVSAPAGHSET